MKDHRTLKQLPCWPISRTRPGVELGIQDLLPITTSRWTEVHLVHLVHILNRTCQKIQTKVAQKQPVDSRLVFHVFGLQITTFVMVQSAPKVYLLGMDSLSDFSRDRPYLNGLFWHQILISQKTCNMYIIYYQLWSSNQRHVHMLNIFGGLRFFDDYLLWKLWMSPHLQFPLQLLHSHQHRSGRRLEAFVWAWTNILSWSLRHLKKYDIVNT